MSTTRYFYMAAIIICLFAVYFVYQAMDQPQPLVYMAYNSISQAGAGYINNTLLYPIEITSIYCTIPDGTRQTFGTPNNNILVPGSNTVIEVGISGNAALLSNCTGWKVSYYWLPANTVVPNSPIVQKS